MKKLFKVLSLVGLVVFFMLGCLSPEAAEQLSRIDEWREEYPPVTVLRETGKSMTIEGQFIRRENPLDPEEIWYFLELYLPEDGELYYNLEEAAYLDRDQEQRASYVVGDDLFLTVHALGMMMMDAWSMEDVEVRFGLLEDVPSQLLFVSRDGRRYALFEIPEYFRGVTTAQLDQGPIDISLEAAGVFKK